METLYQRIPASEWAERYQMPVSAVVQRIRVGIYDGIRDGDDWYVLREVPPGTNGPDVGPFEKLPPGFDYEPPSPKQLPWKTAEGPFRWVSMVTLAAFVVLAIPFVSTLDHDPLAIGVAFVSYGAAMLYEGLRTGAMRNNFGFRLTYAYRPGQYIALGISYLLLILIGFLLLCMAVIGWPRAV